MNSFIQSCSIDTTAYFFYFDNNNIIKVHKNNFQIINLSHVQSKGTFAVIIEEKDCRKSIETDDGN